MSDFQSVLDHCATQPKPKKRRFWMVDAPKERDSKAPTNRVILFRMLEQTESRSSVASVTTKVVNTLVFPFYKSAGMKPGSKNTLRTRAKNLYDQYRSLTMARDQKPRPSNFAERCSKLDRELDQVFNASPAKIRPSDEEKYRALEV